MDINYCLRYNEEKGLFLGKCLKCDDSIFSAYDKSGWVTRRFDVPNTGISIRIESNFNYGDRSYLYAVITKNQNLVLDFSIDKLYVLNHSSVSEVVVDSKDWKALFTKIVDLCKNYNENVCPTSAIRYVDEILNILESETVNVKCSFHKKESVKWDGYLLTTSYGGNKLKDLLDSLENSEIDDDVLTEHILKACKVFIRKIKNVKVDTEDRRMKKLAEALYRVIGFMMDNDEELDFLSNYVK